MNTNKHLHQYKQSGIMTTINQVDDYFSVTVIFGRQSLVEYFTSYSACLLFIDNVYYAHSHQEAA